MAYLVVDRGDGTLAFEKLHSGSTHFHSFFTPLQLPGPLPTVPPELERVAQVVELLAKPLFVYRMARNDGRPGAEKRMRKALEQIDDILTRYAAGDLYGERSWIG